MNRRYFLMGTAAGAAVVKTKGLASPNDTIRVATVGIRGRGGSHITAFSNMPGVELAALCDIDESVFDKRLKPLAGAGKRAPKTYTDIRKLLEDKSIDAISIATPNFHHTLQTIWACQAGKDVYVEKPCSYNMFEARQVVAAARKYERIVQHGSQGRSSASLRAGVQQMREGLIGEVYMTRGLCFKWRDTIKHAPEEPVPAGVHYDLWVGPARMRPFTRNRFHYNWHWQWEYGNGDLGNQGIHEVDRCRWGLGVTYPVKVSAIGGHFMFDDDQDTPNTLTATYEFDVQGKKKMMVFEVRHWMTNGESGIGEDGKASRGGNCIGNEFYGSKGYMVFNGNRCKAFLGKEQAPAPAIEKGEEDPGGHFGNFIRAVRSRKRADLNAEVEEGAISTTLVHLANISYRVGRTLHFDEKTYSCKGDPEANRLFTRAVYRPPFVIPKLV
jgi:predicted dehydrogenase